MKTPLFTLNKEKSKSTCLKIIEFKKKKTFFPTSFLLAAIGNKGLKAFSTSLLTSVCPQNWHKLMMTPAQMLEISSSFQRSSKSLGHNPLGKKYIYINFGF